MRRARLLVAALLIGLLALSGCAATPLPGSQAHYVLKFHHDLLESSPQHIAAVNWANEVAKRTNGRVEVQVFAANQVGDDREAIEMLMIGNLQGAIIPTAKLALFVPPMQLADLPFLFPNAGVAHKVLDGKVGEAMLNAAEPVGLKGLAFWESGFKQFTGDRPLLKPQDFAGLKFRTMESPVVIAQFKALGANPTPINLSETYNALQQHVVDGQENPLVSIVNLRFYEVQSHTTISNHAYLGYAFLLSKAWYAKLPPDLQQTLQETVREATGFQREESARQEQGFLDVLKASKSQVDLLPEQNRPLFEAATRPVHEQFAGAIGRDLLQQAYSEIDRFQRESR